MNNNELQQTDPLLHPIRGYGVLFHQHGETRSKGQKMQFCGFLYIIYFAHMTQYLLHQFSLFHSFSAHCAHCYIVMFCYSALYIILLVCLLVSTLKNTNLHRFFCCFA